MGLTELVGNLKRLWKAYRLLRRALREVVPPGVANRPKRGLPTPTGVWLRGELGEWADSVLAGSDSGNSLNTTTCLRSPLVGFGGNRPSLP